MSKVYFAENLRFLRQQKEQTQTQLADELGVTRSRIGSYEEKRSEPSLEVVIQFSNYFNVSISDLIEVDIQKTYY